MKNHRIIPAELAATFPAIWQGFDLRGMPAGTTFFGCRKCGVQTAEAHAAKSECPICQGTLEIFNVTQADLAATPKP